MTKRSGKIKQVEITSCGLNGGPLRGEGDYPAYIACHLFVEKPVLYAGDLSLPRITQDGRDGDMNDGYIANIQNGTTIGFKYFDCKGVKRVAIETRAYCHGVFQVKAAMDGPVLAEIPVSNSMVWERRAAPVDFPDGKQALYLTYRGSGTPSLGRVGFEK